jgi:PAT family beta-lactamase induction signal transducer AmpG
LQEVGFTKLEIGEYVKFCGLISAILGAIIGGALMFRLGVARSLLLFGIFQMASTAGFVLLAETGRSIPLLAGVIAVENFTGGMGTAAFVAFLATACNRDYSAAQYAALTSFMRLPALLVTTQSGWMVERLGWSVFFTVCVVIALPGLILVKRVSMPRLV